MLIYRKLILPRCQSKVSQWLSIDSNGQYFLNLGDDAVSISLEEIKSKVQIIFTANPEIEVVLKSDSKVEFDYVAKALASIQSVGVK